MFWQPVEDAAPFFDVEPMQAHISDVREIEHAIEAFARNGSGGLMSCRTLLPRTIAT
jgi:hypothetical protein